VFQKKRLGGKGRSGGGKQDPAREENRSIQNKKGSVKAHKHPRVLKLDMGGGRGKMGGFLGPAN